MGIKFLNQFQLLQWCFPLMGTFGQHCVSDDDDVPSSEPIKLIKSDGHVSVYHRKIHASELMTEFPKHLVCHSDDIYIGRKIPALSEHDQLQLGQKYFLLPNHYFQSVLSFVTVTSFMASQPQTTPISCAIKRAAAQNQLFDVQKTPSGFLRIRVSDEFISQLIEEGKCISDDKTANNSRVCTTAQLEKDYEQMVIGSRTRQWKPKLEMITEGKERKHKRRFSNSFGMKRRRRSSSKLESQPQQHPRSESSASLVVVACPSQKLPPPKPRIRTRSRRSTQISVSLSSKCLDTHSRSRVLFWTSD